MAHTLSTPQTWTLGALLTWTTDFFVRKAIDEPRLSAELLLAHALGCTRMAIYTQYDRVPPDSQLAAYRAMVKQRAEHVPVAYLIGKAAFFSLDFKVTRDVLIPRPDTETLVEQVISRVRHVPGLETPSILDLCTGSGCVAVALAKNLPTARVVATDISEPALAVARENAETNKVAERVEFVQGDLFAAVEKLTPARRFHVVCGNPPYIPTPEIAKLMPDVREHEPRQALDGGADGLEFHRRIVAGAATWLEDGGLLGLEIEYRQGTAAAEIFESAGYLEAVRVVRDAGGRTRCVMGNKRKAANS